MTTVNDPYHEGYLAGRDGTKHWENPYCGDRSIDGPAQLVLWYGGWCQGKQERKKLRNETPLREY